MTNPTLSSVECEKMSASLAVNDLAAAIEFYVTKLGFRFGFTFGELARFAGLNLGSVGSFLDEGAPDPSAGAVFFTVGDADVLYEFHRANGVEVVEEIGDREFGMRDY